MFPNNKRLILSIALTLLIAAAPAFSDERALHKFVDQYSRLDSVHLEMSGLLHLPAAGPEVVGDVSFSYWEQGDRYRLSCRTDASLGLLADVDYAFDGRQFSFWDRGMNVLTVGSESPGDLPTALPNPFFLPVHYLKPLAARGIQDVTRSLSGLSTTSLRAGKESSWLEVASAASDSVTYRVQLSETGRLARPTRIDHVEDGRVALTIRLANYRQAAGTDFSFPNRISLTAFDGEGKVAMQGTLFVTALEVNQAAGKGAFALDIEPDTKIWDYEREEFLKE